MKRINYKSDFDFLLKLTDSQGNAVGWPECDWEARIYTSSRLNAYSVWRRGDELHNCYNDGGEIHVVMDNHRLTPGVLSVELHAKLPNDIYTDGVRDVYAPESLDIELVTGRGDECGTAEAEITAPYIKGEKGDKGDKGDRGEKGEAGRVDLTELTKKQDKLSDSEDVTVTPESKLTVSACAKHAAFWDMWDREGEYVVGDQTYHFSSSNRETDTGELNGITDISYKEAQRIWARSLHTNWGNLARECVLGVIGSSDISSKTHCFCRTYFPILQPSWSGIKLNKAFYDNNVVEVISGVGGYFPGNTSPSGINGVTLDEAFRGCSKLREVNFRMSIISAIKAFDGCVELQEVWITFNRDCDISFADSPKLSLRSLQWLANTSKRTKVCTVTVHPDIYVRLTDESNVEWHKVMTDAAERNIAFATV